MSAIKIKVKKPTGDYDLGCSKMLGNPTIPEAMEEKIPADAMFLMQIRLSDISKLDKEGLLPHEGYLYFFLGTENGIYDLEPIVIYSNEEPTMIIEGFNEVIPEFEEFTQDYIIEFEECEDDIDGNKLLGCPSDWQYAEEPNKLLLQLDPLDCDQMGLFPTFDGMIYFFFGEDMENFNEVSLVEDFS